MLAVGKDPTSPMMVVAPVLVIAEPARTRKSTACPRLIGATAAESWNSANAAAAITHQEIRLMIFGKGLWEL